MLGRTTKWGGFSLAVVMLDKKAGNLIVEQIELLDEFSRCFQVVEVSHLTADREFLEANWFEYLLCFHSEFPFASAE